MSYKEKDWIGMDCCPLCSKPKSIVMNKRMEKTLEEHMCLSPELCDKCLKQAKEEGWFILYECDPEQIGKKVKNNFTGRYLKMRMEALDKAYPNYKYVDENRFVCADLETFRNLLKDAEKKDENDTQ